MKSSLRNKSVFICTRRESYIVRGVRVRERVLSCIFDRFFSLRFDVLFSILPLVSIAQIIPWVNHVLDSVKFKGKRVNDDNNNLRFIIICESSNNNDRWWSCEINKFINLWHSFYKKKVEKMRDDIRICIWCEKLEKMDFGHGTHRQKMRTNEVPLKFIITNFFFFSTKLS